MSKRFAWLIPVLLKWDIFIKLFAYHCRLLITSVNRLDLDQDRTYIIIWILPVWHTEGIPKSILEKVDFENIHHTTKSMQNYPVELIVVPLKWDILVLNEESNWYEPPLFYMQTESVVTNVIKEQWELPRSIPWNFRRIILGYTSRIYFDNVTLRLYNRLYHANTSSKTNG